MCIQDNVAEFAGTTDSTAVVAAAGVVAAAVAEWQQSLSLLAETDRPEMTHMHKQPWYFNPEHGGSHPAGTEMTMLPEYKITQMCEINNTY